MRNLGRYEIETYEVLVAGYTQSREKISYYNNNNEDFFIERYQGTIREGYEQTEIIFTDVRWIDIKTHVVGESFYILDRGTPPIPHVYFMVGDIDSIQRTGVTSLRVIDSTTTPINLIFETEFDCNQAYSLIIYLLESPTANTDSISVDTTPPVIHFNSNYYNVGVLDNSFNSGTFSSDTSSSIILNINTSTFTGTLPITKSDIISHLVNNVTDNRDIVIRLAEADLDIHYGALNGGVIDEIPTVGNYFVKISIKDLGQNTTEFVVLVNLI